jgi:hypothetical protein
VGEGMDMLSPTLTLTQPHPPTPSSPSPFQILQHQTLQVKMMNKQKFSVDVEFHDQEEMIVSNLYPTQKKIKLHQYFI